MTFQNVPNTPPNHLESWPEVPATPSSEGPKSGTRGPDRGTQWTGRYASTPQFWLMMMHFFVLARVLAGAVFLAALGGPL